MTPDDRSLEMRMAAWVEGTLDADECARLENDLAAHPEANVLRAQFEEIEQRLLDRRHGVPASGPIMEAVLGSLTRDELLRDTLTGGEMQRAPRPRGIRRRRGAQRRARTRSGTGHPVVTFGIAGRRAVSIRSMLGAVGDAVFGAPGAAFALAVTLAGVFAPSAAGVEQWFVRMARQCASLGWSAHVAAWSRALERATADVTGGSMIAAVGAYAGLSIILFLATTLFTWRAVRDG